MSATTLASSTLSFKSLLPATNANEHTAVKKCAPERDYDNMYQHPLSPQYVDATTLTASSRSRRRQHQQGMEPLPRLRNEDFIIDHGTDVNVNANASARANPYDTADVNDMIITSIADDHDVNNVKAITINTAVTIADDNDNDNAWAEIMAAMPTTAEDMSTVKAEQHDIPQPHAGSFSIFDHVAHASIFAPTTANRTPLTPCNLGSCIPASPCALYPHRPDFDCRFTTRVIKLHNTALAALVRESEPLTWEEVRQHERERERDRQRWAPVGQVMLAGA
ncbi:hypothetical protein A1O7_03403 [Cladophialophora yegresii CBS 114405]|uniref:Uncharacterized protein n=1 Tax=Cladophialophora yegresii CBS 114405 TaxID=1182544 RepID=W9WXH1_9EURO|nr:uncharacterized protein A1O7_03403 [Cladophialophora yegresii CBS 114405]EXJ62959.1 hypothetical protein A1O7_03403 [Cladophialophora yegresii CBS 114405]